MPGLKKAGFIFGGKYGRGYALCRKATGPLCRDASAQTNAELHAEMLSWSRSRGLFAGISLEGATLRPDGEANRELYGRELPNRQILTGNVAPPKGARRLEAALNASPRGAFGNESDTTRVG